MPRCPVIFGIRGILTKQAETIGKGLEEGEGDGERDGERDEEGGRKMEVERWKEGN